MAGTKPANCPWTTSAMRSTCDIWDPSAGHRADRDNQAGRLTTCGSRSMYARTRPRRPWAGTSTVCSWFVWSRPPTPVVLPKPHCVPSLPLSTSPDDPYSSSGELRPAGNSSRFRRQLGRRSDCDVGPRNCVVAFRIDGQTGEPVEGAVVVAIGRYRCRQPTEWSAERSLRISSRTIWLWRNDPSRTSPSG